MRVSSLMLRSLLALGLITSGCSGQGEKSAPSEPSQSTFDTPDAAAEALYKAAAASDTSALIALFGPNSREILGQADHVQAKREREVVVAAMRERWYLEGEGTRREIVIGNEDHPLPIPLVEEGGKWRFDTEAGKDELRFRRVGRNELDAMEVAAAFVEAQKEYAAQSHDGVAKGAYAQKALSDPGKHNGLYWPVEEGQPLSPMGELAAKASTEGYGGENVRREPLYGYYFKVLTAQGPSAPGGEKSWIVDGAMRGGFGLLAWPAEYGASGVMTFMVGPDGALRQKDLGDETPTAAAAIMRFDPDSSWTAP